MNDEYNDKARFISNKTLGLVGEDPTVAALRKTAKKRTHEDIAQGISTNINSQTASDIGGIRNAIAGTQYSQVMGKNYVEDWMKDFYTNTEAFDASVTKFQDQLKRRDALVAEGATFDLATGDYDLASYKGEGPASFQRAEGNFSPTGGKYLVESYGTADGFYDAFKLDSAASEATFMGQGSTSATNTARNFYATPDVSDFLSDFSGWTGNQDVRSRFSDVAFRDPSQHGMIRGLLDYAVDTNDGFVGGLFALSNDATTMMGDLVRLSTGGSAQVLGVNNSMDGIYLGRESKMKQALAVKDPLFMDWSAAVVDDFDNLSMADASAEGDLSPALAPLVRRYGAEEVKNLLKTANNQDAFVYGLNTLGNHKRMAQYTANHDITLGMNINMLGHGLVTDPTTAVDIGVGMGLMVAGTVTGAAPVAALGGYLAVARGSARVAAILSKARKVQKAVASTTRLQTLSPAMGKVGIGLEKTGKILVNARRALPSQIFSELVFPSMNFMRRGDQGADAVRTGKGFRAWRDYIASDAQMLNKSKLGRAWTRAWQNGLEGGIQGFGDYFVMQSQERAMLEALHGPEAAAQLEINGAGLGLMTGMGVFMGGTMGAGLGAGFDAVGSMNYGGLTRKLANDFTKGISNDLSQGATMFTNYKAVVRKQKIVRSLHASGANVDEMDLDNALDAELKMMELQGLDVDYGIKQAMKEIPSGDKLDIKALNTSIRKHAELRARAFEANTGIARRANTDVTRTYLNQRNLSMTEAEMKDVEASDGADFTADKFGETIDTSEEAVAREANAKALEVKAQEAAARLEALKTSEKAASKAVRKGAKGEDRVAAKELEAERRAELRLAAVEASDTAVAARAARGDIIDAQTTALIDDIAGREMDYMKRLYHLTRQDVNDRLAVEGKGTSSDDTPLGNIWSIIEGKGEDGTVSAQAMSTRFTSDELDSTVLANGKTVREALDSKPYMTPAEAAELVEEARGLILSQADLKDISTELIELERLGRILNSDDEARRIMQDVKIQAEISAQVRDLEAGDVETTGLPARARNTMLKELPREGQSAVERRKQLTQGVNAQRQKVEQASILRRERNSGILQTAQQELDLAKAKDAKHPNYGADVQAAADRVTKIKREIRKGVTAEWVTTRKNIINSLLKEHDVSLRDSEAHVGPLMAFINRLRYEASRAGTPMQREDGSIRLILNQKQILALLPPEYRFLINVDGFQAARLDGTDSYDLHTILTEVTERIARSDGDMATLIREGAGLQAELRRAQDGLDAVEMTERHQAAMMEAQRVHAIALFNSESNKGQYAGGGTRDDWSSRFAQTFDARAAGRLMRAGTSQTHMRAIAKELGVEIQDGDLTLQDVKRIALSIYKAAGVLTSFDELGGGPNARAFETPESAAEMIIESLESPKRNDAALDDEGRYDLRETSRGVKGRDVKESQQPDLARRAEKRQKAQDAGQRIKRLGNVSEALTRRLYEQARTNKRIQHLLFDEDGKQRSDEDIDVLYDWLRDIETRAKAGEFNLDDADAGAATGGNSFRIAPAEWVSRASDSPTRGVKAYVDGVMRNIEKNPPAMISTIHDHIDAGMDGMYGALNPFIDGVSENGFASAQGALGTGFGFRTLNARAGSIPDQLNTAFELTMGVEGLVPAARARYNEALIPHLQDLLKKIDMTIADDASDAEVLGAIARLLDTESTKGEAAQLFLPGAKDLDADASGANVLMANMRLEELDAALASGDLTGALAAEARDNLGRTKPFTTDAKADLYTIVQELVTKDLATPDNIRRLATEAAGTSASPLVIDAWTKSLTVWSKILSSKNEALSSSLRDLFKGPVMTDLYQVGVDKMGDEIYSNFLAGADGALKDKPDAVAELDRILAESELPSDGVVGTTLTRNTARRSLANKLAHMLHSNSTHIEGSKIKQGVFGNAFLSNKDIGKALLKVRRQQFAGAVREPSKILNDPAHLDAIARGMLGFGKMDLTADQHANLLVQKMMIYNAAQEHMTPGSRKKGRTSAMEQQFMEAKGAIDEAVGDLTGDAKLEVARATMRSRRDKNTARAEAFQALANQNFHVDADKAELILGIMHGDEVASQMFDNLSPLAKQAMVSGYFRDLSISAEGRMFVNTVLDMIGDKSMRAESGDNPLGVTKFFNKDGVGMDAKQARRAAILQLAVNTAELTGEMPPLGKMSHDDLTMEQFMSEWADMSRTSEKALKTVGDNQADGFRLPVERLLERSGTLDGLSAEARAERITQANSHFNKLRKNALSGRAKDNPYGDADDVVRMGPWGMVDPRYNHNFSDSVGIAGARAVQLIPETSGLRDLRGLEAIAESQPTGQRAMFSTEEMANSVDVTEMALPIYPIGALDRQLTAAMDFGTGRSGAVRFRSVILKKTLDSFADSMQDYAHVADLRAKGRYDELYVLYKETLAMKAEFEDMSGRSASEVSDLEAYGSALLNGLDSGDNGPAFRGQSIRHRARARGRREFNNVAQWSRDLTKSTKSILKVEHTGAMDLTGGSYEANLARTAQMGNARGDLMPWLFSTADHHGIVLAKSGPIGYKENYDSSRTALFAQMSDSQLLVAAALVGSRQWKGVFDGLGLKDMTAERFRQLRGAFELSQGSLNINTSKFDSDIAELFAPGRRDDTFAVIEREMELAQTDLVSSSFVGDLGATGEGRMLFNAMFSEAEVAELQRGLSAGGRTWADFENEVFTKTIATENGAQTPTAFVNMFGEVINPHEVTGQVRVAQTADERVRAVNNSKNRPLFNRQRTGAALGLDSINYKMELSQQMKGYDGEFGRPLAQVQRAAADESEALEMLMHMTKKKKIMRADAMTQDLKSNRRYLNMDAYETTPMLDSAQQVAAMYTMRGSLFAPLADHPVLQPKWQAMYDRIAAGDKAMINAVLLGDMKGEMSREGYYGVLALDNTDLSEPELLAFADEVVAAVGEVRSYFNLRSDESPAAIEAGQAASEDARTIFETNSLMETQTTAHDAVASIMMNDKLSPSKKQELINKLNTESDPASRQEPGPSMKDVEDNPSAFDVRSVDDGRVHTRLLRLKDGNAAKRRLDTVFAVLEGQGTISKQDRLLLDATFHGMDDSFAENVFAGIDFRVDEGENAVAGEAMAMATVDGVVQRITVAKNLHEQMNGTDAKFGAAGVVLEEVGHLVDLNMRASNSKLWGQTVDSYLTTYGAGMHPAFKTIFGSTPPKLSASEGLARGYAAVMMSKAADEILNGADANMKQWLGQAHVVSLTAIRKLRSDAVLRRFEDGVMTQLASKLRDAKPIDMTLRMGEYLRVRGEETIDTAWRANHDDAITERQVSEQNRRIYEDNLSGDGRLDMNSLRETYHDNQPLQDAMASNEIMAQLEVLGGGAEVTTTFGSWVSGLVDQVAVGWGRKVLHNTRAWSQPAATISQFLDSGYGVTGEMTTIMRGLASIMSPTETMSMAGFSTLSGGRVPTLTGMQGEIRGRWDSVMETLFLLKQGDKALNKVEGSMSSFNEAISAAMRTGDDPAALASLSETDQAIAKELIIDARRALRMTADDMLEAGMIRSEKEAQLWREGLPMRLTKDTYNGDNAPAFRGKLAEHIARKMQSSNTLDTSAIRFIETPDGEMLWRGAGDELLLPSDIQRFRDSGLDQFADKVEAHIKVIQRDSLKPVTWDHVLNTLGKTVTRVDQLDPTFRNMYDQALSGEITNPVAVERANAYIKTMDGEVVKYPQGYAGLRATKTARSLSDSAHVLYSDPYIDADGMMTDPELGRYIETDLVSIFDGVMRGPAAQGLDRATYGRAFGVRGMGVEDITKMLKRMVKNSAAGNAYATIDKVTGQGGLELQTLDAASKKLMLNQLSNFDMAIKYAKGTMSRADLEANDTPFFKMLNDVMALSTTAMVGPRYFLGAIADEIPQAVLKGYGDMLSGLRGHVDGVLSKANSRAARKDALSGITTFIRDIQHDSAVQTRMTGQEGSQFLDEDAPRRALQTMNDKLSKFTGLGFRDLTQRIKAHDVRASVARMTAMMKNPTDGGDSMYDGLVKIASEYDLGKLEQSGELNEMLRTLGFRSEHVGTIREMLRMGIFDQRVAAQTKRIMSDFVDESSGSINFDKAGEFIQSRQVTDADRVHYMTALSNLRTMISIDSIRNSKGTTVADASIAGTSLQQIMTRLQSYSSMVSGALRRQALGGASATAMQTLLYMIAGYAYFRATQMARGKSFDEAVLGQWEENPEVELYDMIMSVPFLGYSQMPLAFLFKQVGMNAIAGQEQFGVKGGKAYSVAAVATLNRMLELLSTIPQHVRSAASGELKAREMTIDLASGTPTPFNWLTAPMMGEAAQAWQDSKAGALTQMSVRENPNAAAAWFIREVLDNGGIDISDIDADQILQMGGDNSMRGSSARDIAALSATQAAQSSKPSASAGVRMPGAPAPEPATAPPASPLEGLPTFKDAPDTLR